jgi:hypothetical protein
MPEKAVKALIESFDPVYVGKVGGDLSYDGTADFYVWIGLVPGGSSDQIGGQFVVDIDVFSKSYAEAMNRCLELEARLIGPRHNTGVMRVDNCYQIECTFERPWNDETVFRVGATYVFTARRSG